MSLETLLDEITAAGWKITSVERPYHGDWRVVLHDEDHTETRVGGAIYELTMFDAIQAAWQVRSQPVIFSRSLTGASQLSMSLAALIPKAPPPPPLTRRRV